MPYMVLYICVFIKYICFIPYMVLYAIGTNKICIVGGCLHSGCYQEASLCVIIPYRVVCLYVCTGMSSNSGSLVCWMYVLTSAHCGAYVGLNFLTYLSLLPLGVCITKQKLLAITRKKYHNTIYITITEYKGTYTSIRHIIYINYSDTYIKSYHRLY